MDLSWALRRVSPEAADLGLWAARTGRLEDQLIEAYMPHSLPEMKAWLHFICSASDIGAEFVKWTAKHAIELNSRPGGAGTIFQF